MYERDEVLQRLNIHQYYQTELGCSFSLTPDGWSKKLHCPFHDDKHSSFQVNALGGHGGFVCFACDAKGSLYDFHMQRHNCDFKTAFKEIAALAGFDAKGLPRGPISKTYDYNDQNSELLYQSCRYEVPEKSFSQRRPGTGKKEGQWIQNMKGVHYVPYNLPMFDTADTIYVCEGEKAVDAVVGLGFVATTCIGGATSWQSEVNRHFQAKNVVILPDNDKPGEMYAEMVGSQLTGIAKTIRVLKLPGLPQGGDAYDWIEAGGTQKDLQTLVDGLSCYTDIIDEINSCNIATNINGKFVIMHEGYNPVSKRLETSFGSVWDTKSWYANREVMNPCQGKGQPKLINPVTLWMKSKRRRQCEGIAFAPDKDLGPNYYNLWRGFGVQPKQGSCPYFDEHVFEVVCNGNNALYAWVQAWMSRMVQDPGCENGKPGIAFVLRGGQGVGKGCFLSNFGRIFGNHFLHVSDQQDLTGRFNDHLKDVLLLFVDEGFWAGDKSAEGIIKSLITEDFVRIESKGQNAFQIPNFINLAFASNNDWVVPSGLGERRFCVVDVPGKHKGNVRYFDKIFNEMNNGGTSALMYNLLNYDVSSFDLASFPRTPALFDQVVSSMTSIQKFCYDCFKTGRIRDSDIDWGDPPIKTCDLYNLYVDRSQKIGIQHKQCASQFGKDVRKYWPKIQTYQVSGGQRYYKLGELDAVRLDFQEIVGGGGTNVWDEDVDDKNVFI